VNFGIRGHDLGGKQSFNDFLAKVSKNNIEQVQLAFKKSISDIDFSVGHYNPGLAHFISKNLKANNIHVAVLGCYINPTNPNESKRKEAIKQFIENLKYAKKIGADLVGTETGRYDENFKIVPYTYTEGCYQLLLETMGEIVSAAEKLGVIVGIEPVATHTLYCPEIAKRFLDDLNSPNVEIILDPVNLIDESNFLNQEDVLDRAFRFLGDKISIIHIKDFRIEDGNVKFEKVGDGLFNYEPLFKFIKENKPHITMLIENSNEERFKRDCEYLKAIYDRV